MNSELSYYLILFVYISLWCCQMVVCHLTHSILDISVGIIHLKTQRQVAQKNPKPTTDDSKSSAGLNSSLAGKLFNSSCTYNFKRLPLLGSFINGLFLAALLMSAAIEGIQTCFHSGHSIGHDGKSILLQNPRTYPLTLVGFAIVGLIMQYCSMKAHELREEELCSESLLDINRILKEDDHCCKALTGHGSQLNVIDLLTTSNFMAPKVANNHETNVRKASKGFASDKKHHDLTRKLRCHSSFESIPLDYANESQISLKSLKFSQNPAEELSNFAIKSISRDLESAPNEARATITALDSTNASPKTSNPLSLGEDRWTHLRFLVSPVALSVCASIIYAISDELITEISDASLSVIVVSLLFASSYPPMKKAGKVLLQTAPDGIDLDKLRHDLRASNPAIVGLSNLRVWSLTLRSNRVATCGLILNPGLVGTKTQVADILRKAKLVFLSQNIKCTTIEPIIKQTAGAALD